MPPSVAHSGGAFEVISKEHTDHAYPSQAPTDRLKGVSRRVHAVWEGLLMLRRSVYIRIGGADMKIKVSAEDVV